MLQAVQRKEYMRQRIMEAIPLLDRDSSFLAEALIEVLEIARKFNPLRLS